MGTLLKLRLLRCSIEDVSVLRAWWCFSAIADYDKAGEADLLQKGDREDHTNM